jgi:hypothetical protein
MMADRDKMARKVAQQKVAEQLSNSWAYEGDNPEGRDPVIHDHEYDPKDRKTLGMVLRSVNVAMGHAASAQQRFVKIRSSRISPDGNLGGKGFVMAIPDMRKQLANIVEALSGLSDTLYDEVKAPHWEKDSSDDVEEIIENAEEVREDPETWADQDMEDSFGADDEEEDSEEDEEDSEEDSEEDEEDGESSTNGEETDDEEEEE